MFNLLLIIVCSSRLDYPHGNHPGKKWNIYKSDTAYQANLWLVLNSEFSGTRFGSDTWDQCPYQVGHLKYANVRTITCNNIGM